MSRRDPPADSVTAALQWDRTDGAPRVTAAGKGYFAERLREEAERHGVNVHEDPELAKALAALPTGEEIPERLYLAVAEVLLFAFWATGRLEAHRGGDAPSGHPPESGVPTTGQDAGTRR